MRALRPVVALVLVVGGLSACSGDSSSSLPRPSKAFCKAAYDFDTNAPKLIGKIHQQTALVQKMADAAPRDVAKDAQTYLDAMHRRAEGDTSVVDNAKVEQAVKNVERRAAAGCDLYKQDPSNSGI